MCEVKDCLGRHGGSVGLECNKEKNKKSGRREVRKVWKVREVGKVREVWDWFVRARTSGTLYRSGM